MAPNFITIIAYHDTITWLFAFCSLVNTGSNGYDRNPFNISLIVCNILHVKFPLAHTRHRLISELSFPGLTHLARLRRGCRERRVVLAFPQGFPEISEFAAAHE
jgi:hypothetical protein